MSRKLNLLNRIYVIAIFWRSCRPAAFSLDRTHPVEIRMTKTLLLMRSIWKGAISFGLVNIPVKLYSAVENEKLSFQMLYRKDLSRIRFKRVAESTGEEVAADQIVKGYELEDGKVVTLTDEELRDVSPEKSTGVDIQAFVSELEIDSLYFDRPYYLEPDKGAGKAYTLLRDALTKSGKVGIAQFVLRNREHLCALKPYKDILVLNLLRFAEEIRDHSELTIPKDQKISANEVTLATRLIEGLTTTFDPSQYRDTYTEEVRKMIESKAKGQKAKVPVRAPTAGKVVDLVAALQESLGSVKKGKKRAA
jgi:DNA end-binding protein Ku